eukprot:884745_1
MKCVGNFKAFNCSILQIVSNSEYEQKALFSENEYKLVQSHADDMKDVEKIETAFKYNDKIIISNDISQHQTYTVCVSNSKLFGINDYIEFQRIDGVSFNQFPNTFRKALTLELS